MTCQLPRSFPRPPSEVTKSTETGETMLNTRQIPMAAILCLGAALGCKPANTYVPPPPPEVSVAVPIERPITEYLELTGVTRAVARVELKARVNGFLKQIAFKDGAFVQEGDLLFVIDPTPYEVERDSARASQRKAEAVLQLEEAQLQRTKDLVRVNAASKEALDVEEAERATAAAEVKAAESAVRRAELELSYTEVRAPLTGRIGRRQLDIGDLVRAEETLLATIESVDPIHAYFTMSEADLLRFLGESRDQPLTDPMDETVPFELALGDSGNFNFEGRLDYKEFGVDPASGTATRRAVFPNASQTLVPGLFVRVRTSLGQPSPRLLVEERAIGFDQRGAFVLVVNGENVVEYRLVRLGALDSGMRVVESGLTQGERVVVNGLQRARPGGTVVPKEVTMGQSLAKRGLSTPNPSISARASRDTK